MNENIFGAPLAKDPSVALPEVRLPNLVAPGPIRKLQFVIEIVGPRTMPATAVQAILQPHWQQVLASPEIFVMAGADSHWRPLVANDGSGAYDSLVLCWDLLSKWGDLSVAAAQTLWTAADDLAKQLGRRALAIPVPVDVPQNARFVREAREALDIGFNLSLVPVSQPFEEKQVWRVAAALGLQYAPNGSFQYLASGNELPLFEVFPGGDYERFLLSQVQNGISHTCMDIGFSVPLCPHPQIAMEGCFRAGVAFEQRLKGVLLDEDGQPMTERRRAQVEHNLGQAAAALQRAGIVPGSTEAVRLFGV